jgi:hypothetical protein
MLRLEGRVAAVEGWRYVSYLNRWTLGSSINCQSGWPACVLRVEPRTFETAFVFILVNDTSFSNNSCDVSFGMSILYQLFQQIISQTVMFPADTRTVLQCACSFTGLYCVDMHWERCPTVLRVFACWNVYCSEQMLVVIDAVEYDFLFHRELLIKYVCFHKGALVIRFSNTAVREPDCIRTLNWWNWWLFWCVASPVLAEIRQYATNFRSIPTLPHICNIWNRSNHWSRYNLLMVTGCTLCLFVVPAQNSVNCRVFISQIGHPSTHNVVISPNWTPFHTQCSYLAKLDTFHTQCSYLSKLDTLPHTM